MKIYTKYKAYNVPSYSEVLKLVSELIQTSSQSYFSDDVTIDGDLLVNGDIVLLGDNYVTHAEDLYTKQDLIHLREGAILGLGENLYTGVIAEKYDGETNGLLVFDANGEARVGDEGDTQPLLTRAEKENLIDGAPLLWDAANNRAVSSVHKTIAMNITYEDGTSTTYNICVEDEPKLNTIPMQITYEDGTTEIFNVLVQ